jgi:hypothetical protein
MVTIYMIHDHWHWLTLPFLNAASLAANADFLYHPLASRCLRCRGILPNLGFPCLTETFY